MSQYKVTPRQGVTGHPDLVKFTCIVLNLVLLLFQSSCVDPRPGVLVLKSFSSERVTVYR